MGDYLSQVNAASFYAIVAAVLAFITIMCGYIVVKCYRARFVMVVPGAGVAPSP